MQGFYGLNRAFASLGASASKANIRHPGSLEEGNSDNSIVAQPSNSKTIGQISSPQIIAADLLPVLEPHYAGPIAVVIIIGALIYYGLYKFAGSGQKMAQTQDPTGYPVTYQTNTQINYHYDTDGQKIESRPEKLNSDKGDR